jgi:hypothetical protein
LGVLLLLLGLGLLPLFLLSAFFAPLGVHRGYSSEKKENRSDPR